MADETTLLRVTGDASGIKTELQQARAVVVTEAARMREALDITAQIRLLTPELRRQVDELRAAGLPVQEALAVVRGQASPIAPGVLVETDDSVAGRQRAEAAAAAAAAEAQRVQAEAMRQAQAEADLLAAGLARLTDAQRTQVDTLVAMGSTQRDALAFVNQQATGDLLGGQDASAAAAARQAAALQTEAEAMQRAQAEANLLASGLARLTQAQRAQVDTLVALGSTQREALDFVNRQSFESIIGGANDAAEAQDNLAQRTALTKGQMRDLSQALSLVNPQLGAITRGISDVVQGLDVMGTAAGLKMLATAASIAVVVGVIKGFSDAIDGAVKKSQEFREEQERLRQATMDRERSVSGELGKRGISDEDQSNRAVAASRRLETMGFDRSTAAQAAAVAVGQDVSDEDLPLLAAGIQSGDLKLGGDSIRQRAARDRQAVRRMERMRDDLGRQAAAFTRPAERMQAGMSQDGGGATEKAEFARRELGWDPEKAKQAGKDLAELERNPDLTSFDDEGLAGDFVQDISGVWHGAFGGQSHRQMRMQNARELGAAVRAAKVDVGITVQQIGPAGPQGPRRRIRP